MTPEQISLVQSSFQKVLPIKDKAAGVFYTRLFELNPALESIFPADLTEQGKKLMAALATLVSGLAQPDTILPAIKELGARHIDYGAKNTDYGNVGEALIWSFERGLGDDFTPAVRDAWIAAYTLLSNVMIEAADARKAA
ncbi:hemin receptor [bacterium AH-315-P15]|nr:hemin receptor [bacterium AH-315-P15]